MTQPASPFAAPQWQLPKPPSGQAFEILEAEPSFAPPSFAPSPQWQLPKQLGAEPPYAPSSPNFFDVRSPSPSQGGSPVSERGSPGQREEVSGKLRKRLEALLAAIQSDPGCSLSTVKAAGIVKRSLESQGF